MYSYIVRIIYLEQKLSLIYYWRKGKLLEAYYIKITHLNGSLIVMYYVISIYTSPVYNIVFAVFMICIAINYLNVKCIVVFLVGWCMNVLFVYFTGLNWEAIDKICVKCICYFFTAT